MNLFVTILWQYTFVNVLYPKTAKTCKFKGIETVCDNVFTAVPKAIEDNERLVEPNAFKNLVVLNASFFND